MSNTEDIFFSLLRFSLWRTPLDISKFKDIDWDNVVALSQCQAVRGLIASAIKENREILNIDDNFVLKLTETILTCYAANQMMNNDLSKLIDFYRKNDIEGILLKGHGVSANYPEPDLRQCGDIDYYIGLEQARRLVDFKHKNPYCRDVHFDMEFSHVELHLRMPSLGVPWRNRSFMKWSDRELAFDNPHLRKINIAGIVTLTPPATYEAFFIFYHAWYHLIGEGVGLRQICDLAVQLHTLKGEIDYDELKNRLKSYGLYKAWKAMSWVLVNYIGLQKDEMPFYDSSERKNGERIINLVLEGGNFGRHFNDYVPLQKMPYLQRKKQVIRNINRGFAISFRMAPMESFFSYLKMLGHGMRHIFVTDPEYEVHNDRLGSIDF